MAGPLVIRALKLVLYAASILLPYIIVAQNTNSDSVNTDSVRQRVTVGAGMGKGVSKDTATAVRQIMKEEDSMQPEDIQAEVAARKQAALKNAAKQSKSDTVRIKKHNPRIAAGMSALLPGLGQIYNKKYWKLPIIYVGLGVCGYFIYSNTVEYSKYKETYLFKAGADSSATDFFPDQTLNSVKEYKEYYHKNIEISYIVAGVLYLLNIIDATVDAHLYDFSVSDDLTMRIEPVMHSAGAGLGSGSYTGVKLALKF